MGYDIESPYIDIYYVPSYESVVTENITVKGLKYTFKIYTTFNPKHDRSSRIKLLSGPGSSIKSDTYIILNDIEFDSDGLLLPSSYKQGKDQPLTSGQLKKIMPKESHEVISDLLRECKDDFNDCFNKKISEAELKKILETKFKDKGYKF